MIGFFHFSFFLYLFFDVKKISVTSISGSLHATDIDIADIQIFGADISTSRYIGRPLIFTEIVATHDGSASTIYILHMYIHFVSSSYIHNVPN